MLFKRAACTQSQCGGSSAHTATHSQSCWTGLQHSSLFFKCCLCSWCSSCVLSLPVFCVVLQVGWETWCESVGNRTQKVTAASDSSRQAWESRSDLEHLAHFSRRSVGLSEVLDCASDCFHLQWAWFSEYDALRRVSMVTTWLQEVTLPSLEIDRHIWNLASCVHLFSSQREEEEPSCKHSRWMLPCRNELDAHLNQFHSSPLLIELSAKKAFWQLRLDINLTAWLCLQASEPNTRLILQPNVGHMLLPKKPRDTVSKRPDRRANESQSASTMHCTAACSQGYQRQAALPKMNRLLCKGCKLCRISASQVEKVIRLTVTVVFSECIQPLCNTPPVSPLLEGTQCS